MLTAFIILFFLRYVILFGILVFFYTLSFYLAKIACFVNLEYGFFIRTHTMVFRANL